MTIEEVIKRQMNISKTYENVQSLFTAIPSVFRQSEVLTNPLSPILERYEDLFTVVQQAIPPLVEEKWRVLYDTISNVAQAMSLNDYVESIAPSLQASISSIEWYPTLDPILPIMEEAPDADNYDTKNVLQRVKERKPLSFNQLVSLLSLIMAVLSFCLSFQPNPQTEKEIQQRETLIEQGEVEFQQNERLIELLEATLKERDITECLIHVAQSVADEVSAIVGSASDMTDDSGDIAIDNIN